MADVIQLRPAPEPDPKRDIDPRFQGVADRAVGAGYDVRELLISRDFGYLQLQFADPEQADAFASTMLSGMWQARLIKSQYDSHCRICGKSTEGEQIYWEPSDSPRPIRKYRKKPKLAAAVIKEKWVDRSWVCHVACLPVAAAWGVHGDYVRLRAQDIGWVEHRLQECPMRARMRGSDEQYPIISEPDTRPPVEPPPTCIACGGPIIGRRRDARYCCRAHQLAARPRTAAKRRELRQLWASLRATEALGKGL